MRRHAFAILAVLWLVSMFALAAKHEPKARAIQSPIASHHAALDAAAGSR